MDTKVSNKKSDDLLTSEKSNRLQIEGATVMRREEKNSVMEFFCCFWNASYLRVIDEDKSSEQ